jgi:hypothetical protein
MVDALNHLLHVGFDVRVKSWIDGDAKIIEEEEETTMRSMLDFFLM